jgi:hypothetical protein
MIEFTEEQRQELEGPRPVEARDPVTNAIYVLVRKETYERLRALVDGETVLATAELVDRVMADDDAKDPYLQEYQR